MTNDELMAQTVRIVNAEHPHYRETGTLTGKVIAVLGKTMAEVRLMDCRHGTDGCFVSKGDIELDTLQPRRPRRAALTKEG